jgi:uncharacterized membrane protein
METDIKILTPANYMTNLSTHQLIIILNVQHNNHMTPTLIFGLTSLGVFHTIVSLVAVIAGALSLIRNGKISWDNFLGKTFVITTVIVCFTGFGIFQHGGFGKPHVLGIITLLTLGVAWAASKGTLGTASPFIERVGYSLTFFFHIVPAITEAATRLPLDAPFASSPDDPRIQVAIGVCFILFIVGAILQVKKMRAQAS